MLIVSWNVAGLGTTVQRIDKNYGCHIEVSRKRKQPSSVFKEFIERHNADIVCIQESKIPLSQLQSRSEPLQCAHVEGYESFWCCCVTAEKKGFNGVVTYARMGTVVSANAQPLGCPELDDQGRCVMTDHGAFVVFNVYAPAGGGNPMSFKMKFLKALRRAMQGQRSAGKRVILVGDLNISHTKHDDFWASRRLDINSICREVQRASDSSSSNNTNDVPGGEKDNQLPEWKTDIARAWPTIISTLKTKTAVEVTTTNPRTGDSFQKYRLAVTRQVDDKNDCKNTDHADGNKNNHAGTTRQIFLGKHEESPGHCYYYFDFEKDYYIDQDTGETILVCEENLIPISTMAELMSKIGGIEWDEQTQRRIAASDGICNPLSPPRRWLDEEIITQDNMIDAFRYFHPNAEGRFTIWDQFRNKRYSNEGARIDFTLIDASLKPYLQRGDETVKSLRCGCSEDCSRHDPNSEEAALCAATCGGKYVAVSFEGGGIVEASQTTLEHCSHFGKPHTGMIYSPPSLSDHIPVCVLLDNKVDDCLASRRLLLRATDKSVRDAQPHKKQRTIKDIFSAVASSDSSSSLSGASSYSMNQITKSSTKIVVNSTRKGLLDNFRSTTTTTAATETVSEKNIQNDSTNMGQSMPSKVTKINSSTTGKKSNTKRPVKISRGHPSVLGFFQKKSS